MIGIRPTTPLWKKFFASFISILGLFILLTSPLHIYSGHHSLSLATAIFGCGLALPGVWWFYCEREDMKLYRRHLILEEKYQSLPEYFSTARGIRARPPLQPPAQYQRDWVLIISISMIMLVLSLMLPSSPPQGNNDQTEPTQQVSH